MSADDGKTGRDYFQDLLARSTARQVEAYVADQAGVPEGYIALRLVPVEVFGTNACCEHGDNVMNDGCPSTGYGLSDCTGAESDCNRARGRIYRVDDLERAPGENVLILVRAEDRAWFDKVWGDEA